MDRFTAEDAFESSADNDPIMLSAPAVMTICQQHSADPEDFWLDEFDGAFQASVDAARLLGWLGY